MPQPVETYHHIYVRSYIYLIVTNLEFYTKFYDVK